jgi:hypothetical protein
MNVSPDNKYLVFIDGADDAAMYHVSKLQSVTCAADGVVIMKFTPGSLGDGQAASVDVVTLAVTADSEKTFMLALANEIVFGNSPTIVVGDDVTSSYLSTVTAVTSIALDA